MRTTAPNPAQIQALEALLRGVRERAVEAGVFGEVSVEGARLCAAAKAPAAPAWYRIEADGSSLWVSLVTADRWLSHSIEADLLNTGDDLDELIGEELGELGFGGAPGASEHFRDEDKLFTFRTPVPAATNSWNTPEGVGIAAMFLFAYEQCFRRLGDIETAGSD